MTVGKCGQCGSYSDSPDAESKSCPVCGHYVAYADATEDRTCSRGHPVSAEAVSCAACGEALGTPADGPQPHVTVFLQSPARDGSATPALSGDGAPVTAQPRVHEQPNREVIPSATPTTLITLFFGAFGLIPAAIQTNNASRAGATTNYYWLAFGQAFLVSITFYLLIIFFLMV
jgi:hypothetical protein